MEESVIRDYSLIGKESKRSIELGLANAEWYQTPIPREKMRELLVRRNGPAIRDTLLWFSLILSSGYLVFIWWGSWLAVFPYILYSILYASTSDSRWHESSHGTAFKTDWMNNALYEIASFMVFRQSTVWRWSHTRHHSDTIIRGRDPEISIKRPPSIKGLFLTFFGFGAAIPEMKKLLTHASGKIDPEVATYVPESEYYKVIFKARIYLSIFLFVILLSILTQSILPLMYVGLPTILGSWLMPFYGFTQHAGLDENVLDHRLNSRTVYMNRIHRYLYWNMNYHVEHHMFPLVPYHALPKLHELMKADCPKPNTSIYDAFKEIIPAILKQRKDTSYFINKELPETAHRDNVRLNNKLVSKREHLNDGLIEVCSVDRLPKGEVIRFDFESKTYAIYHTEDNEYYATAGMCTHGNAHLGDGVVIDGMIECAKHNGRFELKSGKPLREPVCVGIKTYEVSVTEEKIFLRVQNNQQEENERTYKFRVLRNNNVATYVKELVLEPIDKQKFNYRPGQYIQLEIPPYKLNFNQFAIDAPYSIKWEEQNLYDILAENEFYTKRNYSMATNPAVDNNLRFNIRIALPPKQKNVPAGIGSSYAYSLKPDDIVNISDPYGDFQIQESEREKIYIGGGAGMAPLRSHISHLFETQKTKQKITYWYGARSQSELYYADYFEKLEKNNDNFSFYVALSNLDKDDEWDGYVGFIHEIVYAEYLKNHSTAAELEYYLCGPPAMVNACRNMLQELKIPEEQIFYDEF